MKARELMMGDWVFAVPTPEQTIPIKILSVSGHGVIGEDIAGNDMNIDEVLLDPIPLTPEILEKNKFKGNNHYQYIYKDNYCKVCVSFAPRIEIDGIDLIELPINVSIEGALFDINMNVSAIHQLQQALRLCGITKEIEL